MAHKKIPLPQEEITALYLEGLYCREIGVKYKVDEEVIRDRLVEWGVPRRNRGFQKHTRNPSWKDGRSYTEHPHTRHNRAVARAVAALCLGRPLAKEEVVHHMDEIIFHNDPPNLRHFLFAEGHLRYHRQLERLPLSEREDAANRLVLENGGQVLPPSPVPIMFEQCRGRSYLLGTNGKRLLYRELYQLSRHATQG